jgi:hypothetical protein
LNQKLYEMARVVRAVVTTTNTFAPSEDLRTGACAVASRSATHGDYMIFIWLIGFQF